MDDQLTLNTAVIARKEKVIQVSSYLVSFTKICSCINTANPEMFSDVLPACRLHYKECLVELINLNALDPLVLFDGAELIAEMCRWKVPIPAKPPSEADQRYKDRLRQVCEFNSFKLLL